MIDNGIHYVDLSRYFSGKTPRKVKATSTFIPGQLAIAPMIYTLIGEYEPEDKLMTTLHFNNIAPAPALHHYLWYLDGTEASALITRSGNIKDGHTEIVVSFRDDPETKQVFSIQGSWVPDAWGGSMAEMLNALAEGREPETSGRDNLNSIRVTNAAVESYKTGLTIELPPES